MGDTMDPNTYLPATPRSMVHLQHTCHEYYEATIKPDITTAQGRSELERFIRLIVYSPGFFENAQNMILELRNRQGNNEHANPAIRRLLEATNHLRLPPSSMDQLPM